MSANRNSIPLVIGLILAVGGLPAFSGEQTPATTESGKAAVSIHPAPSGAGLFAVPVLAPGKPAWVSVRDASGVPVAHVSVMVNGVPTDTDAQGQAAFTVPNAGAVVLSMKSENGDELGHSDYALLPNGMLATPDAGLFAQKLLPARVLTHPSLLYAPELVEAGQQIVVLGSQFDAHPLGDKFVLDGETSEMLSGSPAALLVVVPARAGAGPIKEAFVATKSGENTNVIEADVVKVQLDLPSKKTRSETTGSISLVGTNLPALVELTNDTPDVVAITDKEGRALGEKTVLIMPGGEPNSQPLNVTFKGRGVAHVSARLLGDVPELTGDTIAKSDRSVPISQSLAYASIVKLKRRLLGVESRLADLRKLQALPGGGEEEEKRNAETRALSVRQLTLSSMLSSRKAIMQALGGGDDQVRKAIDDAAGGAYYILESQARPMSVVPENIALQSANRPAPIRQPANRLGEPKFVLWAPPEWMGTMAQVANTAASQAPLPGELAPKSVQNGLDAGKSAVITGKQGNGGIQSPVSNSANAAVNSTTAKAGTDKATVKTTDKNAPDKSDKSTSAKVEKNPNLSKSTKKSTSDESTTVHSSRRRRHSSQTSTAKTKHMSHQRRKRKH